MKQHNKLVKKQILNNCNNKISKKVKNNKKKKKRKRKLNKYYQKKRNYWINQIIRTEMTRNLLMMYRWIQLSNIQIRLQMRPINLVRNM